MCKWGAGKKISMVGKEKRRVKATKECLMEESKTHKLAMDLDFSHRAVLPVRL